MKKILFIMITFPMVAFAAPPFYQCWNGSVVKNPNKCPKIILPIICPNGKIVNTPEECGGIICLDSVTICPPLPQPDKTIK